MEKVDWTVEGMTCGNCALTISKFLEKQGMQEVKVNPIDGKVSFRNTDKEKKALRTGIEGLGYHVKEVAGEVPRKKKFLSNHKQRFLFTLPFTAVLMLHMLHRWVPLHWLMNSWLQLGLCLPVFMVGMRFFGKSAWKSLRNGMPNMNVLVSLGSLAAFVYSLAGMVMGLGESYLFFETAAKQFLEATRGSKVFALHGEMGSGKTTFIRALCNWLQVSNVVTSPTFSIMQNYPN